MSVQDGHPLKSGPFRLFWSGQTVSLFGDHLYLFSVLIWILLETESAVAMAGALTISAITAIAWAPHAGVLADRIDRRKLLITINGLYAIVVGLAGVLIWTDQMSLVVLYVTVALVTSLDQFYAAAVSAAIPNLVAESQLVSANSLVETSKSVTGIVAPIIGGVLIGVVSIGVLLVLDAVTFIVNAIFLSRLRTPLRRAHQTVRAMQRSVAREFWDGARFIRKHTELLFLIAVLSVANVALAPMGVLIPAAVVQDFDRGGTSVGVAMGIFALGVLVASLAMSWIRRFRSETLFLFGGLLALGAGNALFGLVDSYALALVGSAIAGGGTIVVIVMSQTVFQRVVPDELLGRVSSFRRALAMGLRPLGLIGGAVIADATNPQLAIVIAALLFFVVALAGLQLKPIRSMVRREARSLAA